METLCDGINLQFNFKPFKSTEMIAYRSYLPLPIKVYHWGMTLLSKTGGEFLPADMCYASIGIDNYN